MKRFALAFALTVLAPPVMGAAAAKQNHGHDGGKPAAASDRQPAVDINVSVILGERERDVVRSHYASNCPPGLAKKRNGCLPPGQAKKRYEVGRRVPDGVEIVVLPSEVILRLPPLPRGYGYRVVDGDLVVVAIATLVIAGAIGIF